MQVCRIRKRRVPVFDYARMHLSVCVFYTTILLTPNRRDKDMLKLDRPAASWMMILCLVLCAYVCVCVCVSLPRQDAVDTSNHYLNSSSCMYEKAFLSTRVCACFSEACACTCVCETPATCTGEKVTSKSDNPIYILTLYQGPSVLCMYTKWLCKNRWQLTDADWAMSCLSAQLSCLCISDMICV